MRSSPRSVLLAFLTLGLGSLLISAASAQQQAVAVQLPTFSFFSVNTTVSVPDSGAGYRQWLARQGARRMQAAAAVADQASQCPAASPRPATYLERSTEQLAAAATSTAGQAASRSVAELRRLKQAAAANRADEATQLEAKAAEADANGKPDLARLYRQMAARRLSVSTAARVPATRVPAKFAQAER